MNSTADCKVLQIESHLKINVMEPEGGKNRAGQHRGEVD